MRLLQHSVLLLVAACSLPMTGLADEGHPRPGRPDVDHIFEKIDADGNGSLSKEEFKKAHQKFHAAMQGHLPVEKTADGKKSRSKRGRDAHRGDKTGHEGKQRGHRKHAARHRNGRQHRGQHTGPPPFAFHKFSFGKFPMPQRRLTHDRLPHFGRFMYRHSPHPQFHQHHNPRGMQRPSHSAPHEPMPHFGFGRGPQGGPFAHRETGQRDDGREDQDDIKGGDREHERRPVSREEWSRRFQEMRARREHHRPPERGEHPRPNVGPDRHPRDDRHHTDHGADAKPPQQRHHDDHRPHGERARESDSKPSHKPHPATDKKGDKPERPAKETDRAKRPSRSSTDTGESTDSSIGEIKAPPQSHEESSPAIPPPVQLATRL